MKNMTTPLLLIIILTCSFGHAKCQSYCDVCDCQPDSSNPALVQCIGPTNLTTFPANISTSVISLAVSGTSIARLTANDLNGMSNLITLTIINNNQLTTIEDGAFRDLSALPALNLRGNSIFEITASTLDGLANVKELNVESNLITSLPNSICASLPSLETVLASQNSLPTVGETFFAGCQDIVHIDLSDNRITTIDEFAFLNLSSLNRLEVTGNPLTKFYSAWIANKTSSFKLALPDNFTCTQQLKDEYRKMLQSHPLTIGCNSSEKFCPRCLNHGGRALINITMEELTTTTTMVTSQYKTTSGTGTPTVATSLPTKSNTTSGGASFATCPSLLILLHIIPTLLNFLL